MREDSDPPKKRDKKLLYLLALVGILIIVTVVALMFGQKDQKPSDNLQFESPQSSSTSDSAQSRDLERLAAQSMDVEREADIKLLHMEVEEYYTTHGTYPFLAQLNDSAWRIANTPGIEEQSLKDPEGTEAVLVSTQTEGAYAYAVTPAGCDNASYGKCTAYIFTVKMESGQVYTKKSLYQ